MTTQLAQRNWIIDLYPLHKESITFFFVCWKWVTAEGTIDHTLSFKLTFLVGKVATVAYSFAAALCQFRCVCFQGQWQATDGTIPEVAALRLLE